MASTWMQIITIISVPSGNDEQRKHQSMDWIPNPQFEDEGLNEPEDRSVRQRKPKGKKRPEMSLRSKST